MSEELNLIGKKAKKAAFVIANASSAEKENLLQLIADEFNKNIDIILDANNIDIENAKARGISSALLDRLILDKDRIKTMADGVLQVKKLPDPVGEVLSMWKRPNKILIGQKRVPLGVVGIIYEARPNVTADATALCLKAGNAVILRGGSEAINSNTAIVDLINKAIIKAGFPEGCVQLIEDISRETARAMMQLNQFIDVLIPRGGPGLIETVINNATIPVIETGAGNCHIYVDKDVDYKMAEQIIINAKTQRPGVCNAVETLLINQYVANEFLQIIIPALFDKNVEIRACGRCIEAFPELIKATEEDWFKEYLDNIIAIKIVNDINEAISHINKYSTNHSEAIITNNYPNSQKFLQEVDSSVVFINASTRFTDGCEFGFGAEIGISTQKLHARGPMGLKALTTTKYIVYGDGQIR